MHDLKLPLKSALSLILLISAVIDLVSAQNEQQFRDLLSKLLIVRDPGSTGNAVIQEVIMSELRTLNYTTEKDHFEDSTPFGTKSFTNIIGSQTPEACNRLVLACHFDSKLQDGFLGATDSAAPCAMLLTIARELSKMHFKSLDSDLSLDLIFFDGEEAFVSFTDIDGLYGSRHLAKKWSTEGSSPARCSKSKSRLSQIKLFVLLDLLGSKNPTFYNYYPSQSAKDYGDLISITKELQADGLLKGNSKRYFSQSLSYSDITDDHKPFMKLGTPVLHLIPSPFPKVWHTNGDNLAAIDMDTSMDLMRIIFKFTTRYLEKKLPSTETAKQSTRKDSNIPPLKTDSANSGDYAMSTNICLSAHLFLVIFLILATFIFV
ncbi:Glutaminyl-peptide cyclotransferase [Halotydeus destructor]|nr:Glutaminyl-peptide cyclotransferase [Halotydeus destructor]